MHKRQNDVFFKVIVGYLLPSFFLRLLISFIHYYHNFEVKFPKRKKVSMGQPTWPTTRKRLG